MSEGKKYLDQLESIGEAIKKDVEIIVSKIKGTYNQKDDYEFFNKLEFTDLESLNKKSEVDISSLMENIDNKTVGIYIFRIKNIDVLKEKNFDKVSKGSKINKNMETLTKSEEYTLYLGKSKTIKTRIKQHFNNEEETTPYSLKLNTKARKKLINSSNKLFILVLKEKYDKENTIDIKNIIISSVESLLHDQLLPLVGTCRT